MQNLSLVCQALRNGSVVDFITKVLHASYRHHFQDRAADAISLVDESFDRLVASQKKGIDIRAVTEVGIYCNKNIMKINTENSWFGDTYSTYRREYKVIHDYSTIERDLVKGPILDFGSGDGYFTNYLTSQGYDVWGTDIADYRASSAADLRFSIMQSPEQLGNIPLNFNNVVVKSVLHHVDNIQLNVVLRLLREKAVSRLIVKEDVCMPDTKDITRKQHENDVLVSTYLRLGTESQMQYLGLMDYIGNYVVQGLFFINLPCNFKSISQWESALEKNGFLLEKTIPELFSINMVHPGPHIWMICTVRP